MILHLQIIGFVLILLALIHAFFYKYFNWRDECQPLNLLNRQMFYVHTFFIALTVFLMGIFCLVKAQEMTETELGKTIALGFGIFWFARLLIQFFGYSPELWRGKRFETTVHILFSILWTYFTTVFFLVYFL